MPYAGVTLPNDVGSGMHRAAGFKPVGVYHHVGYKFGAWHDVAWLEQRLQSGADAPSALIPIRELITSAAGQAALNVGLAHIRR